MSRFRFRRRRVTTRAHVEEMARLNFRHTERIGDYIRVRIDGVSWWAPVAEFHCGDCGARMGAWDSPSHTCRRAA